MSLESPEIGAGGPEELEQESVKCGIYPQPQLPTVEKQYCLFNRYDP